MPYGKKMSYKKAGYKSKKKNKRKKK